MPPRSPRQKSATSPQAPRHPIQIVTRRTGLSPAVLRMWERRHGVVRPGRSPKGRRLYSDEDVERLRLLARATHGGRTIGQVAGLSVDALADLVRQDASAELDRGIVDLAPPARRMLEEALHAIQRFEANALQNQLRRGMLALPAAEFLDDVLAPLLRETGERWRAGTFRPVHGQLAAAVVRGIVDRLRDVAAPPDAPEIVVATPTGQVHDLGALLTAATASAEGWSVTYLGAGIPAEDLAEAVHVTGARALALSIVHPSGDRALSHELRTLGTQLPRATVLLAGGEASASYGAVIDEIGGERIESLDALRLRLRAIR